MVSRVAFLTWYGALVVIVSAIVTQPTARNHEEEPLCTPEADLPVPVTNQGRPRWFGGPGAVRLEP